MSLNPALPLRSVLVLRLGASCVLRFYGLCNSLFIEVLVAMPHKLSVQDLDNLETTARVASCFSLAGTSFVIFTFLYSPVFHKPVNRLIFYASLGNTVCNIATLMAQSPIRAGPASHLCQLQGFLIQWFLPADALWNMAMAVNVYLTLFRNHNAKQLKTLEWRYWIMCYGVPFIVALTCLFVSTAARGKVYGPATVRETRGLIGGQALADTVIALVFDQYEVELPPDTAGLRSGMVNKPWSHKLGLSY